MKKYLLIFISFLIGFLTAFGINWWQKKSLQESFKSSTDRNLDYDPRQDPEKSKSSLRYFFETLPQVIKNELNKKYASRDYLTSCQTNMVIGSGGAAVSFFTQKKAKVLIFRLQDKNTIDHVYDISDMVNLKQQDDNDFLQINCTRAAPILRLPQFQILNQSDLEFVKTLQTNNEEILQIKSRNSSDYGIFAYRLKDDKFHQIGILSAK